MIYKVHFAEPAKKDAKAYADYIKSEGHDAEAARRWLEELEAATDLLSEMPRRFRIIDEQQSFPLELRQFLHYSHRVIFHVDDSTKTVHILRIYHMSLDVLRPRHIEYFK